MNQISKRQLLFLLAFIAPVGKLVLLPARLSEAAANDLLLPALFQYGLQAGAVFCVLLLAKRGMSFFGLLKNTFGKVAAKVLLSLYALFLLYAALLPVLEQKLLVQTVFYDTLPSLVAFFPFFLFAAYVVSKPLASYGRMWDLLAPLAGAGLLGILVLSAGNADFSALAPVGASGFKGFYRGTMSAFAWFYDAALLLPLLGKFEYEKGLAWKGALAYLGGGAAVMLFYAVFYGIFREIAPGQLFAFTATSKYFSGVTTLGRIDYIFIFALSLVMAFWTALPLQEAADCAMEAFGRPRYLPTLLGLALSALYFALSVVFDCRFTAVLGAVTGALAWIFPVFCLLVPVLMLFTRRKRRED